MSGGPPFDLGAGRELRALAEADAAELYALVDTNRAHLARWMQWAHDQTAERTLEFIRETHAQHAAGEGFQGAVTDAGSIVGVAGMHRVDRTNSSVELGYWLAAGAQGAGIMTAAVRALVRHAFDDHGLHRVEICAAVDNVRSRALIERLGFAFEGVARGHYRIGGDWHDDAVYALLAGDPRGDPPDAPPAGASLRSGEA